MVVILFPQNWQALEQIPNKDLYFILAVVMIPMVQPLNMVLFCETGKTEAVFVLAFTAEMLQQENLCVMESKQKSNFSLIKL